MLAMLGYLYFLQGKKQGYKEFAKIIKINSDNSLVLLTNKNKKHNFKIEGISYFDEKWQTLGFNSVEILSNEKLLNLFLKEKYLGKNVQFEIVRKKDGVVFGNLRLYEGKNIAKELFVNGFVTLDIKSSKCFEYFHFQNLHKFSHNQKLLEKQGFLILNLKNQTLHKLSCKYALLLKNAKLVENNENISNFKKCSFCFQKAPKKFQYNFIDKFEFENATVYFSDLIDKKRPDSNCSNAYCRSVLNEIKNAKMSIDIASFGVSDVKPLINEIKNAQNKRNLKVRFITDLNSKGQSYYPFVPEFLNSMKLSKTDCNEKIKKSLQNKLMHHKFIIIDEKVVFTGSSNLSNTDLSNFNSNINFKFNSEKLASVFKKEFDQMFNGNFHMLKENASEENVYVSDNLLVSAYFAPKTDIIEEVILKRINNAKSKIYIPMFFLTHKEVVYALIKAKKRNIEVKIILDATAATSRKEEVELLRKNKIQLKVENQAGKMHSKALIIDSKTVIAGSMNLTFAATKANDENIIVIENEKVAKTVESYFLYIWERIDEKWLHKTPLAEGFCSINSCFDGVDNNFDGKIDSEDPRCKKTKK